MVGMRKAGVKAECGRTDEGRCVGAAGVRCSRMVEASEEAGQMAKLKQRAVCLQDFEGAEAGFARGLGVEALFTVREAESAGAGRSGKGVGEYIEEQRE